MSLPVIGGKALATLVSKEVLAEGLEEVTAQINGALRTTLNVLAQNQVRNGYIATRKFIRTAQIAYAQISFGDQAAQEILRQQSYLTSWGGDKAPVWSFSSQVQKQVDRLPGNWKIFVESALDEGVDSFFEAGYIIANTLDQQLAARQAEQLANPGRGVVLYPDRENPREQIVLTGNQEQLVPQVQGLLANQRALGNREVGQIVGVPVDDYVREKNLSLRLKFELFDRPSPPYSNTRNNPLTRVSITVPDIKRSSLNWTQLKLALGGNNGYLWGRFKARGRLDGKRYITVFGATENEAVQRLKAVMSLSSATLLTINVTEELKEIERVRNPRLQKETKQVYPGYVSIINRGRVIAVDQGRASVDGQWTDKRSRFELWRETPPADFDEQIRELFRFAD